MRFDAALRQGDQFHKRIIDRAKDIQVNDPNDILGQFFERRA